ncbi:MAG: hypothetical protein J6T10_22810 [Methanobrevibacter sp.]|nr:hypothetical protein [Methanobrevibacter sp.]
MGLLDRIKQDAQKSGQNKGKFFFVKDGQKKRIRFLQDLQDGFEIVFHDNFEAGINVPCQETFGRSCQYCDEEGIRTRSQYIWSIWDCEDKEVKLFMYPMNNCSPIGQIAAMYETYGTLTDRDYVISVSGKQQNKQFSVIPMDKQTFKNSKAKAISRSKFLEILDNAYPDEHSQYSDDSKGKKKNVKEEEEELDYSEMTAKELYKLCEEREIEAEPKMKQSYYISLLEEYDENSDSDDNWDDEEEDENDYSSMSAKELYNLCKERDIDVQPKKPEKYYIRLLEEYDDAHEDWEDDSDEDDEDDWE